MLTLLFILLLALTLFYPFYCIYKPPRLLIHHFAHRWPDVLWEVEVASGDKVVALTIDDAPSQYSEEILKVLKENGARATFFVIGNQISDDEGRLKKLVAGGMELGNHAMRDEASRSLSIEVLEKQIVDVQRRIDSAYAFVGAPKPKQRFFRPGSGFFNDAMRKLMGKLVYKMVLGGVYPHDPQISWPGFNARHVLSMVRPGAIVICHDRRGWTVPMLKRVLPELKRRGYSVVTLSELVERGKKD